MNKPAVELLNIIARAAPFSDKIMNKAFRVRESFDQKKIQSRLERWKLTVAQGEGEKFEEYLRLRKFEKEDLKFLLSDLEVDDPDKLPAWAKLFLRLMKGIAAKESETHSTEKSKIDETDPFTSALLPFFRIGADDLNGIISTCGVAVSSLAHQQFLELLGSRLSTGVIHILDNELQTLQNTSAFFQQLGIKSKNNLDNSYQGWVDRLERYPGLAYVLSISYLHWFNFVTEFLTRLAEDSKTISEEIFSGTPLGALKVIQGDAGDLHNKGRAVVLVTCEAGKFVYKPKDLRVSECFMDLVSFLNQSLPPELQLHVHPMINMGEYAWEAFVEHQPCKCRQEVETFYQRFGMILRVLQLLGARDFWLDNLIASGSQPVFIDLEMVVQLPMNIPGAMESSEKIAYEKLQDSIVPIGAVAQCTPLGRGVKAEDFGALTTQRRFNTPFKLSYSQSMRKVLSPVLGTGQRSQWTKTDFCPVWNGEPTMAADFFEEVISGYSQMQKILEQHGTKLLRTGEPLSKIFDLPVRYIHRDTWTCISILNDSVRPACLVDSFNREIFLESLSRNIVQQNSIDYKSLRIAVSEIDAFREMDVPLFQAIPSKKYLIPSNGDIIDEYFPSTALLAIKNRLESIHKFPLDKHLDLIRSNFSTGPHNLPFSQYKNEESNNIETHDEAGYWKQKAVEIGDSIIAEHIESDLEDVAWLGLIYHPDIDLHAVDVLRPDLLSGTCGLALFFAELYAATGLDRFRTEASRTLIQIKKRMTGEHLLGGISKNSDVTRTGVFCGGHYGIGSKIYTLRRCGMLLNDPELLKIAESRVQDLPWDRIIKAAPLDLACGSAGLVLSMLPKDWDKGAFRPSVVLNDLIDKFMVEVNSSGEKETPVYPPGAELMKGVISHEGGIALCLAHLSNSGPALLSGKDSNDISGHFRVWAAKFHEGEMSAINLLNKLVIAHTLNQGENIVIEEIKDLLGKKLNLETSRSLIPIVELAQWAFKVSQDSFFSNTAIKVAGLLNYRKENYGTWFPENFAADRHELSAIYGVAAIGLGYLRIDSSRAIPCYQILE